MNIDLAIKLEKRREEAIGKILKPLSYHQQFEQNQKDRQNEIEEIIKREQKRLA